MSAASKSAKGMLELRYPRDLAMVGAIFGVAGFMWAGWAQENPPGQWVWRMVLAVLGLAAAALTTSSLPLAIKHWNTPTALTSRTGAMRTYLIVFSTEVILAAALALLAVGADRSDLMAPLILGVVGIHFVALARVFAQPVLYLAAGILTAVAVVAGFVPGDSIARSFWCGVFGAPVLVVIGGWCTATSRCIFRPAWPTHAADHGKANE